MEYTLDHQTTYYYPDSVNESYTVLRLRPRSDQQQFCTRYALELFPKARVHGYVDRYGNDVQHFAILPSHASLSITTHSSVVTLLDHDPPEPLEATRALLEADSQVDRFYDFTHPSTFVRPTADVDAFRAEVGEPGDRIGAWCHRVSRHINASFAYDTEATTVRTTVDEALVARAGVCQDFAHVMIAILRSVAIPARYVSGYIFRGDSLLGAEASHAWCEAYLPPYGWVGFDPTNDLLINDYFVKIAIGRDYRDVSPVRGVYRGAKHSEMSVNVAMEALAGAQQQ
ncbi:MAG: transglutaminase family protein [Candidatus Eremiobacteraeota bacterium]|nr:transglutaminase family protein [Candidatus Eremiobacteraeota bacterium]